MTATLPNHQGIEIMMYCVIPTSSQRNPVILVFMAIKWPNSDYLHLQLHISVLDLTDDGEVISHLIPSPAHCTLPPSSHNTSTPTHSDQASHTA